MYPDFVVCRQGNDKYLVLETKGLHLKGSGDTEYKKALFAILENTYKNALDRGEMNRIGETPATYKILFEDKWKQELREALDSS